MVESSRRGRKFLVALLVIGVALLVYFEYRDLKSRRSGGPPEDLPSPPPSYTPKPEAPAPPLPRMANQPPKEEEIAPPQPSYPPNAPVLEQARKALREGLSPDEAVDFAESLPESPERADAVFLLLEYAAEAGNREAALAVGRFYDPSYEGPSGSILKNPSTAYNWYREALEGGQAQAGKDLARLRTWVEEQSKEGSHSSQELLQRWEPKEIVEKPASERLRENAQMRASETGDGAGAKRRERNLAE